MKALVNLIIGLFFMLLLSAGLRHVFGIVRSAIAGDGIRGMVLWQTDYANALSDGVAQNKSVLIEFARPSSPNCRDLAKNGWSRLDIATAASDFIPVLVDIDDHPDLAKQFNIATVPSLAIIDPKTQSIIRDGRDTFFTPDELLLWLKPDSRPIGKLTFPDTSQFDSQKSPFQTPSNSFSP